MRIGIDAAPLGVQSGGIRRYTEELVRGLARLGGAHDLVLYRAPRGAQGSSLFPGIERDPVHYRGKRFVDQLHLVGAGKRLDLYHGTNYSIPLATRLPTVVTVHDLTVQLVPRSHPWARRMRHQILPVICRRATRIIADSSQTRDDLVRLYGLESQKIDVIHLGVAEEFQPVIDVAALRRVRARYGLPDRFVLYLGALEPRKNLERLIEAFGALKKSGSAEALVIAGTGTAAYASSLVDQARAAGLELNRDFVVPGHIEDRDLAALYSSAALFVFPSAYEGFGLPPLEAMACGTPVALAENSSLAEIYRGVCTMFDGGDAKTIAEAIRKTLGDASMLASRARDGREFARQRTWDAVSRETMAVYERAVRYGAGTSNRAISS